MCRLPLYTVSIAILLVCTVTSPCQNIDVRGTVAGEDSIGLQGVVVELRGEAMCDTTDAAGGFHIERLATAVAEPASQGRPSVTQSGSCIVVSSPRSNQRVRVDIFDATGRQVAAVLDRRIEAGVYRLYPQAFLDKLTARSVYVVRVRVGTECFTQRLLRLGAAVQRRTTSGDSVEDLWRMTKGLAAGMDTLDVSANGYIPLAVVLDTLEVDVDTIFLKQNHAPCFDTVLTTVPDTIVVAAAGQTVLYAFDQDSQAVLYSLLDSAGGIALVDSVLSWNCSEALLGDQSIRILAIDPLGAADTLVWNMHVRLPLSTDASLSSLDITAGSLIPAFSSQTTTYAVSVGNDTDSLTLTPTTADSGAIVTVNDDTVGSGQPCATLALALGPNTVTVTVTAEDGISQRTYTVTVTREISYVFVSTLGGADELGLTPQTPCSTLARALVIADSVGAGEVRVAAGTYGECLSVVAGIDVAGGFTSDWTVDTTALPVVQGGYVAQDEQWMALRARSIDVATTVSRLQLLGPDVSERETDGSGKSSYAVHIVESDSLLLKHVRIQGGTGASGLAGTNGSSAPSTAAPQGIAGGDAGMMGAECDDAVHSTGGDAVWNASSPFQTRSGSGGAGGTQDTYCSGFPWQYDYSATAGMPGSDAAKISDSLGTGGNAGSPCHGGDPGYKGVDGSDGDGGNGAQGSGAFSGIFWQAAPAGQSGTLGTDGGGGGGGGGSGGCDDGLDSYGAGGGSGGAGGLRAPTVGGGGHSGGASFAVCAVNSNLLLHDCVLARGSGGDGGRGGNGGTGQAGGTGGAGGEPGDDSMGGGKGGDGGRGGHSGAGGGGKGGDVFAIEAFACTLDTSNVVVEPGGTPGSGGTGGSAPVTASSGGDGQDGSTF